MPSWWETESSSSRSLDIQFALNFFFLKGRFVLSRERLQLFLVSECFSNYRRTWDHLKLKCCDMFRFFYWPCRWSGVQSYIFEERYNLLHVIKYNYKICSIAIMLAVASWYFCEQDPEVKPNIWRYRTHVLSVLWESASAKETIHAVISPCVPYWNPYLFGQTMNGLTVWHFYTG